MARAATPLRTWINTLLNSKGWSTRSQTATLEVWVKSTVPDILLFNYESATATGVTLTVIAQGAVRFSTLFTDTPSTQGALAALLADIDSLSLPWEGTDHLP